MLKNIKIYSVAALAVLVIAGCGGHSSTSTGSKTASNVKKFSQGVDNLTDAEKLAYAVANQNKTPTGNSQNRRSRDVGSCKNGGTMQIVTDASQLTDPAVSMVFTNCADDGEIVNGSMKFDGMSADGEPSRMTFVTDFRVTGDEEVFVKKGGTMQMVKEGTWEKLIINLEMTINGVTHGGENLIYKSKDLQDGSYIEFPISGKEKIGESAYFTVDTSYDASKTPFKEDQNADLQKGGLFKYKDKENHKVELEVTDTNIVTVRVDSDGDGKFSIDEISAIDVAD